MDDEILREKAEEARRQSSQAMVAFVYAELTVALTSLKVARSRRGLGLQSLPAIKFAERALATAEKAMWKSARHEDFDQMVAQAERVRMELRSLEELESRKNDQAATRHAHLR